MRCVGACVLAAAAAALFAAGIAHATRPADADLGAPTDSAPLKVRPSPSRAGTFAAASIATARRMSPEQREEWRFLKAAAAASRFESEASRMALARSSNAGVRAFATTLIDDHAAASVALQYMLHNRGMAAPMLANDQRKTLNRLAKLRGARFDRKYMDEVGLRYQQGDLQVYEKASVAIRDPVLKGWIDRSLPTRRDRLAMAQRIASTEEARPAGAIAPRPRSAKRMQRALTQRVSARPTASNSR